MTTKAQPGPAPTQGGPVEQFVVERASASPVYPSICNSLQNKQRLDEQEKRKGKRKTEHALKPLSGPLRQLQQWFLSVVANPASASAGVRSAALDGKLGVDSATELERFITAGPHLSALERIAIYHYGYHARLIDALADDYPAVKYALRDDGFDRLARAVIRDLPSRRANLNYYGSVLMTYCQSGGGRIPRRPFITDLARLEWAMCEVFHAQAAPTLSVQALQAIRADSWPDMRFKPSQTVRLLRFDYPVNRFFQQFRNDKNPAIPAREASTTAVYRQGYSLWRMDLTPPMAAILTALFAGRTLGSALATIERTVVASEQEQITGQVMTWFSEWVAGGFFAAIDQRPMPKKYTKNKQRSHT